MTQTYISYTNRMVSEESEKMIVLNVFDSEFLVMILHGRFVHIRMSPASEQSGDFRTVRTPEATQLYFLIIIHLHTLNQVFSHNYIFIHPTNCYEHSIFS